MRSRISNHIRSNVIGYIALFISLTIAPAWAASLAPDSVKSRHIKDGQVKETDLHDDAVTSAKLAPASVTQDSFIVAAVNSSAIADGTVSFADIDNTTVQARIATGCPAGSAIRSVSSTGVATCETIPSPAR
jgi:hypothetical protein